MSKLTMAAAGGIGFLLDSRAGRAPYEKAMARAQALRNDPAVRRGVADATSATVDKAGQAAQAARDAARDKVDQVASGPGTATP